MTKKDKAYLAEGLHRLCADLAAIATLFEQPEEATPKPTPAEDLPAAPAPKETTTQAPASVPDPPTHPRLMDVLKMRMFIGYNTAEIALQMGCSRTRVYQLLEQAKRLARAFLAE